MNKLSLLSLVLTLTLLLVTDNSYARGGKKGGSRSGGRSSSVKRSNSSSKQNKSHKHNNNSNNRNFNKNGSNNSSSRNNNFNRSGSSTRNNNNSNFNNKNYSNKYFGGNNNRYNNVNKSWSNNKHYDHHHNNWHHGHWDNHHHHPVAIGVGIWGAWSVGTRIYSSGYYSYSNPYYVESTVVEQVPAVNYSVPIDPSLTTNDSGQGMSEFDIAIAEFKNGNFPKALELTNIALKAIPNDPAIHEFRALVLFSMGNYTESASAIYSLLSVGPGWDWKTMSSLYSETAIYTQQLRALENYCRENKKDPASRFLLAYHYITCGHIDYAVKELRVVLSITPDDQLAKKLIATFEPEKEAPQNDKPPAPQVVGESSLGSAASKPSIKKEAIVGSWTSDRGTQGKITLTLNPDGNYVWKYKNQNVSDSFKGTYTMGGNILTLVDSKGNPMVANITQSAPNQFNFKLTASGANDPGLDFKK
jgi:tetratricopeptide (TPR) repeat protein